MTAAATRSALEAALAADPGVAARLGSPLRIGEPPPGGAYPAAVWRAWETRPAGASLCEAEEHIITLDLVTRETGSAAAREAVEALLRCCSTLRPASPDVRIVLVRPLQADVRRGTERRGGAGTWTGSVRLRVIAEPL